MKEATLPSVSVVICTLNREESLIHVLRLLKDQTVRPLEILVVDQSTRPLPQFGLISKERVRIFGIYPIAPFHHGRP